MALLLGTKISVSGYNLSYVERGDSSKQTLVFLHNGSTSFDIWTEQIDYLKTFFHIIALDLVNFGASEKVEHDCDMNFHTEVVRDFLRVKELKSISIVGCCIGANIGINLSIQYPDLVEGLFLMNLCPGDEFFTTKRERKIIKFISNNSVLRYIFKKIMYYILAPMQSHLGSLPRDLFCNQKNVSEREVYNRLKGFYANPLHALSRLNLFFNLSSFNLLPLLQDNEFQKRTKVKLLWGGANKIVSLEYGNKLSKYMKKSDYEVIDNTGHLLMLEKPSLINQMIHDFYDTKC